MTSNKIYLYKNVNHDFKYYNRFLELCLENNIIITNNPKKAHVIYADIMSNINKFIVMYPNKKFIIFTNEPYWDRTRTPIKNYMGRKIKIINCYNGIYTNNYQFFPFDNALLLPRVPTNLMHSLKFQKTIIKISMLASYHKNLYDKTKESLCRQRNEIAIAGYNLKLVDLYGKGWPSKIKVKEVSRDGNWKRRKEILLKKYYFNICFENSHIKYYISEKLWDAIKCYNLPIYKGSPWIYEIFPKNSFIDYDDFKSHHDLYVFIKNMTFEEWCGRMNKCIEVFNHILQTIDGKTVKDDTLKRFIKAIRY